MKRAGGRDETAGTEGAVRAAPVQTPPAPPGNIRASVRDGVRRRLRLTGAALALITVTVASMAAGCATVPYTGRRQLSMVSEAEELRQGEQLYAIARRRSRISHDRVASDILQDVGRRIAAVSGSLFYGTLALLERTLTFWHPSYRR